MIGVGHQARAIVGVRGLETGAAKDISGVLRITRGGGHGGDKVEEMEMLYLVTGDGGVKVFDKGTEKNG